MCCRCVGKLSLPLRQLKSLTLMSGSFFYGEDASDCAYACLLRAELAIHLGLARQFPLAYRPDVITKMTFKVILA